MCLGNRIHKAKEGMLFKCFELGQLICFLPFFSGRQSYTQSFHRSSNVNFDNGNNSDLVPSFTKALDSKPINFTKNISYITRPKQRSYHLIRKGNLQLLVWVVCRKGNLHREYQRNLTVLSQMPGYKAQYSCRVYVSTIRTLVRQ